MYHRSSNKAAEYCRRRSSKDEEAFNLGFEPNMS